MIIRISVDLEIKDFHTDLSTVTPELMRRNLELMQNATNSVVVDVKEGIRFLQRTNVVAGAGAMIVDQLPLDHGPACSCDSCATRP